MVLRGRHGWSSPCRLAWSQGSSHLLQLPQPVQHEPPVLEDPFQGFAFLNSKGLDESAGDRDREHAMGVLLDANAVRHGSWAITYEDAYKWFGGVDEGGFSHPPPNL